LKGTGDESAPLRFRASNQSDAPKSGRLRHPSHTRNRSFYPQGLISEIGCGNLLNSQLN
jgi:hypothetical protein